jgi:hypothetical protein
MCTLRTLMSDFNGDNTIIKFDPSIPHRYQPQSNAVP